jgi:hypothetical protein
MAKAWSTWFPDLQPHLPECPTPIIEHELKRAAQAFFTGSKAWIITPTETAVAADTAEVAVALGDATVEMVQILKGWYDSANLDILAVGDLDARYVDDWTEHTGSPTDMVQMSPFSVRLYPIPEVDASTGLKVRVAVRPSESSTGLPDDIAAKFRDAMITGAKARLMLYPGKPWTNVELGAAMSALFEQQIDSARLAAFKSFGRGSLSTQASWF